MLRAFFTAMPNLTHLLLPKILDLVVVAKKFPNLESLLTLRWQVITDVSDKDILKNLKELGACFADKGSIRSMQSGHFATMFNEMINKAIKP